MTEQELIAQWTRARRDIIAAQLGPIFLLTATVALLQFGLAEAPLAVRLAAAGVLLATGILGATAQIASANEGAAAAADLKRMGPTSAVGRSIALSGPWANIVRLGTPAIFVLIFLALLAALFLPGAA